VEGVSYSDGRITIRRIGPSDLKADLEAKGDEQIDWLWEPGQREAWESMNPEAQREHARQTLQSACDSFGPGPKWIFAVDTTSDQYVAYVDCDLANDRVPFGQANISYSAHPAHRGHGHVSGAVRLVVWFLEENTTAVEAHIIVDSENLASLRVARSVGAIPTDTWTNEQGRMMIRHVLVLPRGGAQPPDWGARTESAFGTVHGRTCPDRCPYGSRDVAKRDTAEHARENCLSAVETLGARPDLFASRRSIAAIRKYTIVALDPSM